MLRASCVARSLSVSPTIGALSMEMMKILPKKPLGGGDKLVSRSVELTVTVSVEPSDFAEVVF